MPGSWEGPIEDSGLAYIHAKYLLSWAKDKELSPQLFGHTNEKGFLYLMSFIAQIKFFVHLIDLFNLYTDLTSVAWKLSS